MLRGVRMICRPVALPGGFTAIVCSREKPKSCACGRRATLLCDFTVGHTTCSKPLCERCAVRALRHGADVDYCPSHPGEAQPGLAL
jgi:hypothetical protein